MGRMHFAIACCLALVLATRRADAYLVYPTLDTETLAVEARLTIEGTIGESWTEAVPRYESKVNVRHVRIDKVLNGPTVREPNWDGAVRCEPAERPPAVKAGDVISVAGLGRGGSGRQRVLFLAHRSERSSGPAADSETSAEWVCPPNRLRPIEAGKVYVRLPRLPTTRPPALNEYDDGLADLPPMTLEAFERRVADAVEQQPHLQDLIDHAARADLPRLFDVCRSRAKPIDGEPSAGEHWLRWAGVRIDELAEVDTISDLFLHPEKSAPAGYTPYGVFQVRADCRERLLVLLESGTLPPERQIAASRILDSAGSEYQRDLREAATARSPLPDGGAFARRLASIAIRTDDEESSARLLRGVRDCVETEAKWRFAALDADLAAAADAVVDGWATLSPRKRFDALVAIQSIDSKQADRVAPNRGPFLSQVEMITPNGRPRDRPRHVRLTYRWQNLLPPGGPDATLALVFRSADGAVLERSVDSTNAQRRQIGGQFGNAVLDLDVPPEVTAGPCDVFLRVSIGGEPVGEGIVLRLEVP